jgi:dihydropyrimidine dehydrogenase (NADP+)
LPIADCQICAKQVAIGFFKSAIGNRQLAITKELFMDLSITVNGMKFPNPFVLGSGPPGTNARVLAKSFDAGWGGAVAKTVSLESAKVVNVVPRY